MSYQLNAYHYLRALFEYVEDWNSWDNIIEATEKTFWNKKREIRVDVTGVLKHLVESVMHELPNSIAVRLYHHTTSHCGTLRQLGFIHDIIIPL